MGLEGLVAKRRESRYLPGRRSQSWVKVKTTSEECFTVGGWVEGENGGLAALVLGRSDRGPLQYRGHVALGFTSEAREFLTQALPDLVREGYPFAEFRLVAGVGHEGRRSALLAGWIRC